MGHKIYYCLLYSYSFLVLGETFKPSIKCRSKFRIQIPVKMMKEVISSFFPETNYRDLR